MSTSPLIGGKQIADLSRDAEIVVTGMSGKLPNSRNIEHFMENLLNKVDLCDENTRVEYVHQDIPKLGGRVYDVDKFDNGYFGMHSHQTTYLDPAGRIFLEKIAEAVFDAGLHPDELKGSKTGVFVGACASEYEVLMRTNTVENTSLITGTMRCMNACRASYIFQLNGPSMNCDTACSSSLYALEEAYKSIALGKCDRAIVGGAHLNLDPYVHFQFTKLGVLNMNTGCRPFDNDADGYTRAEAVVAILLEKRSIAKRIYGNVIHVRTNADGFKEHGITFPSSEGQIQLLNDVYQEAGIEPKEIGFLEAHGTGTRAGDPEELTVLDKFFEPTVEEPLLIGSVKGNIGHSEPTAAVSSMVKILTALNIGKIAPNIHYDTPREGIQALIENRLKVVTEAMPFPKDKEYIGLNSFGFGGANGHVIMSKCHKQKDKHLQQQMYPLRLICYSGRTEETMHSLHNGIRGCTDAETLRLLQEAFAKDYDGHLYRGFTIVGSNLRSYKKWNHFKEEKLLLVVQKFDQVKHFDKLTKIPIVKKSLANIKTELRSYNNYDTNIIMQLILLETLKELQIELEILGKDEISERISNYFHTKISLKSLADCLVSISNNNTTQDVKSIEKIIKRKLKYGSKCSIIVIGNDLGLCKEMNSKCNIIHFDSQQNEESFLYNIGKIFEAGYNPIVHKIYENLEFPVSAGTKMLSPLIQWKHKPLQMPKFGKRNIYQPERIDYILIGNTDMSYLRGHLIDNRNLFPATGYLYQIWLLLSDGIGYDVNETSVIFENVRFFRACTFTKNVIELYLVLYRDGIFEVSENGVTIVSGTIKQLDENSNMEPFLSDDEEDINNENEFVLNNKDVYRELRLRGYNYRGSFRAIQEASPNKAKIKWEDKWVTFLDNIMQVVILQLDTRNLFVPVGIDRLVIRPKPHIDYLNQLEDKNVTVRYFKDIQTIRTKFVEMRGLNAHPIAKRKDRLQPVLEYYQFVPNEIMNTDLSTSMRINLQLLLENKRILTFKVVEVLGLQQLPLIGNIITVIEDMPLVLPDMTVVTTKENFVMENIKVEANMTEQNVLFVCQCPNEELISLTEKALLPDGFMLCICNIKYNFSSKFTLLTKHVLNDGRIVYFLRKNVSKDKKTMIIDVSDSEELRWVKQVQDTMKQCNDVVLFAQNNYKSGILGLTNCLTKEPGIENIRCAFIQDLSGKFDINNNDENLEKQLQKNMIVNVFKNREWGTYRHLVLREGQQVTSSNWYASAINPGDLASMKWVQGPITPENIHIYKQHKVVYSAINFRDLMLVTGKIVFPAFGIERLKLERRTGFEYAGYDTNGKRVCGLANSCIANYIEDPFVAINIPDDWSMEDSATVLVVYWTVLRSLIHLANIQKGQSILIHSGTGGVGLAALNVCTYFECNIFVTVGTKEKREYLLKNYPNIKRSQIGNSRDTSFKQMVLRETNNRGVDLILNSLAEEKLLATLDCLAEGGVFLEIGKYDLQKNNRLSLDVARKQGTYHSIMLDTLFSHDGEHDRIKEELKELLLSGIKKGYVKPLPRTIFQVNEIEKAFKYMSTGKHIGKILVQIDHETELEVLPKFYCNPMRAYIIFGGLGGFGLELADWLVTRGAKHLILSSRKGITTGYQKYRIGIWKSYGINVTILKDDVTNFETCYNALAQIQAETPIDGVFNLALVLKDSLWEHQNIESMKTSMSPKSILTEHLDKATRKICPQLRLFVVFSSVSCGRGNAGQTNYGFSNSIMERICELRHADGLPALAVQWGAVGDVGILEEMQRENNEIAIGGTLQQKVLNCLEVFEQLINQKYPVVSSMVVAEKFDKASANSPIEAVCIILGLKDTKTISKNATFPELGMDSMMAVEIKQTLERDFDIMLGPNDLRSLTFSKLEDLSDSYRKGEIITKVDDEALLLSHVVPRVITGDKKVPIKDFNLIASQCKGDFVIALPGIDGETKYYELYAKAIKKHIKIANYDAIAINQEHVEVIVDYLFNALREEVIAINTFKILAHSVGSLAAVELTRRFESIGIRGKLVLIDGAPELMYRLITHLKESSDNLEKTVIEEFTAVTFPEKSVEDLRNMLLKETDFYSQVDIMIDEFINPPVEFKQILRCSLLGFLTRLQSVDRYKDRKIPGARIESKVVLYKPTIPIAMDMADDYNLHKICSNIEITLPFDGNHITMLMNEKLSQQLKMDFGN